MSTPAEPADRLINRERSWLDFNARVLALADDESVPLLERVKFASIFSSNLDEFFQVRVAALKNQVAAGLTRPSFDGRTPAQQLIEVADRVAALVAEQESIVGDDLLPELHEAGITILGWDDLSDDDEKYLVEVFEQRVFPVLTPLAVDPAHPFPYISNLSLNLAVMVDDLARGERRFARVKVPSLLPRFVPLPGGDRFVPLEQLIAAQLSTLFPGMEVREHWVFRVTRNADLALDDEEGADDLLAAVEMELRRRRFGRAVRLEVSSAVSPDVLAVLLEELDLATDDVFYHDAPIDLTGLWMIHHLDRPDLKDDDRPPITPARLAEAVENDRSIFSVIRERALLVHHPYESFTNSVEEFVGQAADDPQVLTIKMTLYRTSGDSPLVRSLIRAAERNVQVAVIVELKARFDEQANITWAKALEQAGVHVTYGVVGLKTHAKCVLVVREEADGLRRYVHIGTGNYNSATARLYEDLGLLSCDAELGADLSQLFNHLTGYSRDEVYHRLILAPGRMRGRLIELIASEAELGSRGRIVMKMNSLADPAIIEALYDASHAGVPIDLIVRGICCLRAGVEGLSPTISVRSLVGRNLEHSRIYSFANGVAPGEPLFLIGSADLMPRNLDRRVECLLPIVSVDHQARMNEILDAALADDHLAWELGSDDRWVRSTGTAPRIDAQQHLYAAANQRSRRLRG